MCSQYLSLSLSSRKIKNKTYKENNKSGVFPASGHLPNYCFGDPMKRSQRPLTLTNFGYCVAYCISRLGRDGGVSGDVTDKDADSPHLFSRKWGYESLRKDACPSPSRRKDLRPQGRGELSHPSFLGGQDPTPLCGTHQGGQPPSRTARNIRFPNLIVQSVFRALALSVFILYNIHHTGLFMGPSSGRYFSGLVNKTLDFAS